MDLVNALISDESGFIVTMELILIVTIVVIGLIAGLAVLRDAIVSELNDVAGAMDSLDQRADLRAATVTFFDSGPELNGGNEFSAVASQEQDNCVQVYGQLGNF